MIGDVIGVVPRGVDDFWQDTTWVKTCHSWPSPNPKDEGVSTLVKTFEELLPKTAKIGIELGAESRIGFPQETSCVSMDAMKPRTFADASDPIFTPLRN
ncbi:hypothetical protein IVB12_03240 [Bradyrhizobium sp. 179]|uniref:hypothetical protein n=1 Tax=Bradyrhizobium sp. 179 TaxID=2782648 RepID=UPI001FF8DBED|nr:hypothetical protein [Bradyrhizobium sp. 179]MCK1541028.1 hypothetical protein [Bradyrhizobium sp. 179]